MGLSDYRRNRRSGRSAEAPGRGPHRGQAGKSGPCFLIQHHEAREEFYDFRLEIDGVLVSWAIPRGPDVNPQERRMARRTEDHPLEEADVEASIGDRSGVDGADGVIVWDHGTYANKSRHEMATCLGRGHLSFLLNGEKLHGGYALTRVREGVEETWLLVKRRDDVADVVNRLNR
jgi:DNA ligase D-like protein (predicted 3'-phosphoesterase)